MTDAEKKVTPEQLQEAKWATMDAHDLFQSFGGLDIDNPDCVDAFNKFAKASEYSISLEFQSASLAYREAFKKEDGAKNLTKLEKDQLKLQTQIARWEKEIAKVVLENAKNSILVVGLAENPTKVEDYIAFRDNLLVAINISQKTIKKFECLIKLESVEDKKTKFKNDIKKEKASIVENNASVIEYNADIESMRQAKQKDLGTEALEVPYNKSLWPKSPPVENKPEGLSVVPDEPNPRKRKTY
jgi:hypothetical protein